MSTRRFYFAARPTRGSRAPTDLSYGRDVWASLTLISAFLGACIRLLSSRLFPRTQRTSDVGGAEKAEKKRLLPEPTFEAGTIEPDEPYEPDSDAEYHHCLREPEQGKSSFVFGERIPVPFTCVQHAFAFQALKYPELRAVEHLGDSLSYGRLDVLSSLLAHRLRASGARDGARVLLLAHRSISFVVSVLGTLKAGASYIPLDGGIVTDESLRSIVEDACPKLVLCSRKYMERVSGWNVGVHVIEDILELVEHQGEPEKEFINPPKAMWNTEDEAYVIYTSGTTGRPKGVSVSHANVTNLICTSPGNLNIQPGTRVSQLLNIAFDMCVWEVLGCLANGGTLVLRDSSPSPTSSPFPTSAPLTLPGAGASIPSTMGGGAMDRWLSVLRTVDVVIATPSILAKLDPKELGNVRTVAVAGEPCSQQLADEWAFGRNFYNCCGPTETTIINTAHLHRRGERNTIGRPTPNNSVYVLDDRLRPVPLGHQGTLWAGGAGVSRGYVNRPDITKSKYESDPFIGIEGSVMYNTGDLGILLPNGEIEHLGRADDQVKIKGFRVELDGVASGILLCPGVASAAALFERDRSELWGFYSPSVVVESDVRAAVGRVQPYYAVPTRFLGLETMPLTSNGKVDKAELRRMMREVLINYAPSL